LGNGAGIASRFADRCVFSDNVCWNTPDGGIVGLGTTNSRFIRNICLHNVDPPVNNTGSSGNSEGFKMSVRGGGGNLYLYNIGMDHDSRGFDSGDSVGNVYLHNVATGNFSPGFLMEGRAAMLWNNIGSGNAVTNIGNSPFIELFGTSVDAILESDFNLWESQSMLPQSTAFDTEPNSINGDPLFANTVVDYDEAGHPDGIISTEALFGTGVDTVAEIQAQFATRFVASNPAVLGTGLTHAAVQAAITANVPEVVNQLNLGITEAEEVLVIFPNSFQTMQQIVNYQRILDRLALPGLDGYADMLNVPDMSGNTVDPNVAPNRGLIVGPN
jgi:hypothetical protein